MKNVIGIKGAPSIRAGRFEEALERDHESEMRQTPDAEFDLPTGGSLHLTLANGARIQVTISEWGCVKYWEPPAATSRSQWGRL